MESFSNDLISCDILNGSQDNDNISWDRWKLAYTDICDKHAEKTIQSMDDPRYHKAYV